LDVVLGTRDPAKMTKKKTWRAAHLLDRENNKRKSRHVPGSAARDLLFNVTNGRRRSRR
jgi:hypothetical protein